jgi:hypothetical protein
VFKLFAVHRYVTQKQKLELLSLEVNSETSVPSVGDRASGVCRGSIVGLTAEGNSSGL